MSSALSSAKNRRANQPPVIQQGKTSDFTQTRQPNQQPNQQQSQQQMNQKGEGQTMGLSLQQVIEIYGRRLNQLETFMNKTQSEQQIGSVIQPKSVQGTSSGPSLAQIQDLIDAKIHDYNDLLYSELQPLREGLEPSKEVVSEADFSEFHTRCQMLAEELFQIKDIVLKLQSFTMSVNKKLADKVGILGNDIEEPKGGLTIPMSSSSVDEECEINETEDDEDNA
jgi:preprotein translocase subunit SecD